MHILNREFLAHRGDRPSVDNVVVVLTDGRSDDDPKGPADMLRARGVKTLAVGITDRIDKRQLESIAGKTDTVFQVREFSRLNRRLKNAITSQICGKGSGRVALQSLQSIFAPGRQTGGPKYTRRDVS